MSRRRWLGWFTRFNHGQTCCAGTRVFVHEGVYDKFIQKFTETLKAINVGDPFHPDTFQGPQVSQTQYNVQSPSLTLFLLCLPSSL